VWTSNDLAVAVGHNIGPDAWRTGFDELMDRVAGRFHRVEPRRRAGAFLLGLLAGLPRVNCWTIAESAGESTPDGMQHLLARASWDTDGVRDDLRGYVVDHLGDPDAVLVVDETGDVKKGSATVGVQRQYTGTAGRIENAQIGVYLVYAGQRGHAFLDRALYLPKSWTSDADRMAEAGVPADVEFATKPALARTMITRALDAGVPARWVAGDEVYGADPQLRDDLQQRGIGYVLAVASNHRVTTSAGTATATPATELAGRLPSRAWHRRSCGAGAKGDRTYLWAWIELTVADAPGCHWLLIRRNPRSGELAFYRAYSPRSVTLAVLARVAGRRWTIEESFQAGKELAGLDEHQVRRWTSWHRWTVLAMLAHAFLAVTAAREHARAAPPAGLIPLTLNEIRRLLIALLAPTQTLTHLLRWSLWRRRHQATARACHYRGRAQSP
jgi:SRSO17 transposase